MQMKIIYGYSPREYSAISHDGGVVLCDSKEGAFLVLRFPEDLARLIALLQTLEVKRVGAEIGKVKP